MKYSSSNPVLVDKRNITNQDLIISKIKEWKINDKIKKEEYDKFVNDKILVLGVILA